MRSSIKSVQLKKLRKKELKRKKKVNDRVKRSTEALSIKKEEKKLTSTDSDNDSDIGLEIQYVPPSVDDVVLSCDDPGMEELKDVISKSTEAMKLNVFGTTDIDTTDVSDANINKIDELQYNSDESSSESDTGGDPKISKRKKKEITRPSVTDLKAVAPRSDVVELWDTTAPDPAFLVWLKAVRNTVDVPRHWCSKSKYMSRKRTTDKPVYNLPEYIEATGISKIRQALQEKEAAQTLKQKQREKARPKARKMDINYQVLHDAFFKYGSVYNKASRPRLSRYGDLHFEGKEQEMRMRLFTPGKLSQKLRQALGIVLDTMPPPWLHTMQRIGPPPSYPKLRIPGVNAPIPGGSEYGYHANGWGKPPIDELGEPKWGYMGEDDTATDAHIPLWGEFEYKSDEEEEEEEEEKEEGTGASGGNTHTTGDATTGHAANVVPLPGATSVVGSGLLTPSCGLMDGMVSVSSGLHTVEPRAGTPMGLSTPSSSVAYRVLMPQYAAPGALNRGGQIFGSSMTYQIPPSGTATHHTHASDGVSGLHTPHTHTHTHTHSGLGSGAATPSLNWGGGVVTPRRHMTSSSVIPGGMQSVGGLATPSIAPTDDDSTDRIRKQLHQQMEISQKAKLAAGQVDASTGGGVSGGGVSGGGIRSEAATPARQGKRSVQILSQEPEKKKQKSKKTFKF
eukprot:GHVR01082735.1.p1 GENE.GHVR01082735.1~~GHVR01082735.1.p1  ORF type:complete len:678 (+),score=246.15 GHVR01082735.1:18-2051(+)